MSLLICAIDWGKLSNLAEIIKKVSTFSDIMKGFVDFGECQQDYTLVEGRVCRWLSSDSFGVFL